MRDLADELLRAKVKARLFGGQHAPKLGRLLVHDRIGAGAMGTVYAAYDPQLDREVAVKVLHAADADANARVLREARALGKLAHPNVVAVHDAAEDDSVVYVVMELVRGTPLRAWIGGEHGWREVVRVLREAAAGIAAAHRAGLVHRDIKPDNVLIGEDRARVVDFGLAGEADGGTPSYTAPEVLAGGPATPASDQFSFGVMLYEALHGQRPYGGATKAELRANALAVSVGGQPAWLAAIVRRTLAPAPGERFPSMDAVVAALGRDPTRRRRLAAVAAGALVLGGVAGALAFRRGETDPCGSVRAARRAEVWNVDVASRVRARLADAPWASTTVGALDRSAGAWEASARRVCEATRVHGAQSDRLLELRMRCLDRGLDRLGALAGALTQPLDRAARAEATSAVAELPDPTTCETVTDAGELALPVEPARRARAIGAERGVDRAWAAFALGRYRDARAQATALEATTRDLDDPVRAQVVAVLGSTEARIGAPAHALEVLQRALALAAAAHAAELELSIWATLLRLELFAGAPARAIEWSPFAHAAARRAGRDGAELDGILAEAERDAGQLAAAREHVTRALASHDPLRPEQRAILELNLGSIDLAADNPERAAAAFQRGYAATRASLGDGHPTLALFLDKLAETNRRRGKLREALAAHEQSIALRRAAFGDTDRAVATALFHRAETLLAANELARATADLDTARAIRATLFGERSPRLGEIDLVRAAVAAAAGRTAEAEQLRAQALALDPRLGTLSTSSTSSAQPREMSRP
jgi:eukaryotic-like serine/threonine-protein kinase